MGVIKGLVYNITQGFVLCCVATESAYKMIWTATQFRNNFFSIFAIQIILYTLLVAMQRSVNPYIPCIMYYIHVHTCNYVVSTLMVSTHSEDDNEHGVVG